ncbi:MAG: cyanophycin synthetase [Planctomycetota bacterium]|jgi:cyanophycin synthetase
MKILAIRALRGPSIYHNKPCVLMRLDLEAMEQRPSDTIDGFRERLEALLPTLFEHRCSVGEPGGFLQRVSEGTWMGHIIEHVAIELQCLAAMEVGYGKTRGTAIEGVYNVVYRYVEEHCGLYAGEKAFELIEHLIAGTEAAFDLDGTIHRLKELRERYRLGPSTRGIVDEATRRGIPWVRLNNRSLVQLGHGASQQRIQATTTSRTGSIAMDLACDKDATKRLLDDAGVPVPRGEEVRTLRGALEVAEDVGYPVVIKPVDGNHGRGATIGIPDAEHVEKAFDTAKEHSRYVMVEQQLIGEDFRALVIDHQFVAADHRVPAHVVGDGERTIEELIEITNADPRRGYGHENVLTEIEVDHMTDRLLEDEGLCLESVPKAGRRVLLKSTANLSTGGTAIDITDEVHPSNVATFERISRIIGLDICGIDIIAGNLREPLGESDGGIIEVNAAPGFRMHLAPSEGLARNVAEPVMDMLFPQGSDGRIPIVAVSGTNGKTTTTRLLAHIMRGQGHRVGFTTSDGVYIDGEQTMSGDLTGPFASQVVLKDPTVDFAVLECARGGILRRGLGFQSCDYAVVINIAEDHLGIADIETLDDLARVKRVVVDVVRPTGWAVLNADDQYVVPMRDHCAGNVAFFSMNEENAIIQRCIRRGRVSCVYEEGWITILRGEWKLRVAQAVDVPLTIEGRAPFMIQNVLAATLTAYLNGVKPAAIRERLLSFVPGYGTTPGRLNRTQIRGIDILIDFAHNPAGYQALAGLVERMPAERKLATISAVGDRRDVDIREMGRLAAGMFSDIVIRETGKYLRGRDAGSVSTLLLESILEAGFDPDHVRVADDEPHAVRQVLDRARSGDLVVIAADDIEMCHDEVQRFKEREEPLDVTIVDIPNLDHFAPGLPQEETHPM